MMELQLITPDGGLAEPCESEGRSVKIEIVSPDGKRRTIHGDFRGVKGRWLFVDVTERIAPATIVSIEQEDVLLIGEVLACKPPENESWRLKVQIEQKLTGLQSLMLLRTALLGGQGHTLPTGTLVGRS